MELFIIVKLSLKLGSKFSIKYSDIGIFAKTIWASTQENLSSGVCEEQRRRPACQSAQTDQLLLFLLLESITSRFAMREILIFYLEPVPEQAGLNLILSETQKTGFLPRRPI